MLRLECVHRRAAKYPVRNVPGLDGFPVIHATQLVFKLAASFGEVDFSLLRSKQFCLESPHLVKHLPRNALARRGHEVIQVLQNRDCSCEAGDWFHWLVVLWV